uniref:RT_RNaseH_2 domain-containing protein n=1 Tax=Steinernema glaseri TaxID=37863 RepID=A0A1I7YD14_9BILA
FQLVIPAPSPTDAWTKTSVLAAIAGVFEPHGLISPALLRGKLFLQQLWKEKYGWKTVLAEPLQAEFNDIVDEWAAHPKFTINRRLTKRTGPLSFQLHTFVDASAIAYSAIVYVRIEAESGVEMVPIFAKSRVGPIPNITIPRMELIAFVTGVRATKFVLKELNLTF